MSQQILALIKGTEYIRDSKGNVYKFLKGYKDMSPHNYLKFIGKISPTELPKSFDYFPKKFSPLSGYLIPVLENHFIFES